MDQEDLARVERMRQMRLMEWDPHNPGQPIALDPRDAIRHVALEAYDKIINRLQYMSYWATSFHELARMHSMARASTQSGVRVIPDRELVNAAIGDARTKVTTALYTAQPGTRPEEVLETSKRHDGELLARGVQLYTIYPDSARARDPESRWAEHMTSLGAQVRTCPVPFPRILYLEGIAAYISDVSPEADPDNPAAIEITNPAMLAWVHMIYRQYWDLSRSWTGGGPRAHSNGHLTTPRDRTTLRLLGNGASRTRIQKELNLSERGLRDVLSRLRKIFDAESDFELALKWRDSEDYHLP
jgi:DNA-binding CsgD family transcriptional regulator